MINWLLGNSTPSPSLESDPVQGNFDFLLETSPSIPETNSNLNIICYKNQSKRQRLNIRVKWYRLKNGQLREIEGVRGNTYNCQPSDLGAKLKAEISSLDDSVRGKAEVWFGPIKFDASLKQSVANILSKGKTRLGASLYKQGKQAVSQITITNREFIIDINKKTQSFQYCLSDPRIQVSSRDTNKVWIRLNESSNQKLNYFLGINQQSIEMSHTSRRQRKIYQSNFINNDRLLELRFNNRSSRDTFIFTIKSFCAEREMKSSLILERLEKIDLNQEELCKQFFDYQSLKNDVIRLDLLNKELLADRDQKILDLRNMEQDVEETTRTYLKIINEKFKDKFDLNKSYSMISQKHDDIQEKRSVATLKDENRLLRARLLDLESEIEQLKSYNEEYENNPEKSPFFKKSSNPELEECPDTIAKLSLRNLKLTAENLKLKDKEKKVSKQLLNSFQQSETGKKDMSRRSSKIAQLAHKMDLSIKQARNKAEINFEQSSILGHSMNTEAGMRLLEQKFQEIKGINDRLLEQNQKLLQEIQLNKRDVENSSSNYKKQIETLQKIYEVERETSKRQAERLKLELERMSVTGSFPTEVSHDNGQVMRIMEQLQTVTEEKDVIVRDIICLEGLYQQSLKEKQRLQNKIKQIQTQLSSSPQQLRKQNVNLISEVNNLKNQVTILKMNQYNTRPNLNPTEMQNKINTLVYENQQLFADLNFVRDELERCVNSLKMAEEDVAKLQEKIKELKGELNGKVKNEEKINKRIKELESQLEMMKRSSNALNRSRDLSADMSQYDGELIETLRKEMEGLMNENVRISEKCDNYSKEMRKLKEEYQVLKRKVK